MDVKMLYMIGSAIFYGCCSLSMNFLNKAILSSYSFNFPFYIMACQMFVTVIVLQIIRIFSHSSIINYNIQDGKKVLPASLCFLLHTTLSLTALHGMNIPMYGAIKRCTPLVTLVLSLVILKKAPPSAALLGSIVLITAGCLIAGAGDLQFDAFAYTIGGLSCFAQAGYFTLVQKDSEVNKMSTLQMLYLNACNTLPIFLLFSMVLGEFSPATSHLTESSITFIILYITLLASGGVLMFSTFLCTSLCSAITTSVVGVPKSFLQTVIGYFTFGGVPYHPLNVAGDF
eukprot:TRINITY_DN27021_c0_g1_i2.p1 TRINITY_DN27021_c0_g1~~TRINITY_DN27021_c0_g1_i2.p1  ORF type:complete len:313 (-),score=31.34 TRINITY_DN27021_c0_g1_i2:208-1065(-)